MKLNSLIILLFFPLLTSAQFKTTGISYLGAAYGFSKYSGNPSAFSGGYYTTGNVTLVSRPLAMVSRFSNLGKSEKFGLGFYGGLDIGASMARWEFRNTGGQVDNQKLSDIELFADLRAGFQGAYKMKDKEFLAGLRYFYHAMGDGVRSAFTNNDESMAIGLFASYKKFGADLNFSSPNLPGFLIESNWNITELEVKYKLGTWDEENYCWLAGLRYEHSSHIGTAPFAKESLNTNMIMVFFALGTN